MLRFRVVNDYEDTRFSKFAIEYLHKNEKVRESSYEAQVDSFKQKNDQKSRDNVHYRLGVYFIKVLHLFCTLLNLNTYILYCN